MIAQQRYNALLEHLEKAGSLTIRQFAELLGVTRETIRRDIKHLSDQGKLIQVRGGALMTKQQEPDVRDRSGRNVEGKRHIATIAAGLVEDGMSILLDSGSTTLAIAERLSHKQGLIVVTNDFAIAKLMHSKNHKVVVLGGEMSPADFGTCSIETIHALQAYQLHIAFVGVGGLSDVALITDYSQTAAHLRSAMLNQAKEAYFVADSHKFGQIKPISVPNIEKAEGLIVDILPDESIAQELAKKSLSLLS